MERDRVYFAHTINCYGTDLEKKLLELIRNFFGEKTDVENPNQPHHQEGYKTWKEMYKDHPVKSGMDYFYEMVLPKCNKCICQTFLDGKWGAGVAHEAAFFIARNQPVWVIEPLTLEIRRISRKEKKMILENNPNLVLSIEQTRTRIWGQGGIPYTKKVPYEQAHLV